MSEPEAALQARICLAVGALPAVRLFRNTVGEGWTGQQVRAVDSAFVVLRNARRVTFGLAPGSHDLVGWRSILITPAMVGQVIAQFVGGEIKTSTGRIDSLQHNFGNALAKAGGLSAVWRSPESALMDITSASLRAGRTE
jgi:hypothetical protein